MRSARAVIMRNHILMVSILALAASGSACNKDKSAPTVPSSMLDEEATEEKQVVNPTLPDEPPMPPEPDEHSATDVDESPGSHSDVAAIDDGPIPVPPPGVLA